MTNFWWRQKAKFKIWRRTGAPIILGLTNELPSGCIGIFERSGWFARIWISSTAGDLADWAVEHEIFHAKLWLLRIGANGAWIQRVQEAAQVEAIGLATGGDQRFKQIGSSIELYIASAQGEEALVLVLQTAAANNIKLHSNLATIEKELEWLGLSRFWSTLNALNMMISLPAIARTRSQVPILEMPFATLGPGGNDYEDNKER